MRPTLVALAMAASLIGSAPAEAQQRMPYYRPHDRASLTLTVDKITQPPAQYAGRYRGQLTVRIVPRSDIAKVCATTAMRLGKWNSGHNLACAIYSTSGPSRCMIILPSISGNVTPAIQAAVRRHELGHCNGWRH
jgi:hypothetical protein